MPILIPNLAVAGEIVNITTGAMSVTVTLPNPADQYVLSGQLSTPTTCWLSGTNDTEATFSFGAPADPGTTLILIAIPVGLSGLNTVVIQPSQTTFSVTVPTTGQSVLPIPQWNTQSWYTVSGNTWIFNFNTPPGVTAYFSYLIVGPGQNTIITQQPIDPGDYAATISTTINDSYLPFVTSSWNTALGVSPAEQTIELQFTNGAPAYAATSVLVVAIPINVTIFPLPIPYSSPTQQPWIVSVITPAAWAQRMIFLFPYPWLSDLAHSTSGVAYALFLSIGTELNFISQQLYYAWSACRLQTASNGALDLFAMDYFGNNLPRQPGESDNAYRIRIQALLFQPQVTRQSIINAIEFAFPGCIVWAREPWNPSDTGYFADGTSGYSGSYYDLDTQQIPGAWGNLQARYQGFLEIQLPPSLPLSYSLWGYDFGAAYDAATGYYFPILQEIQSTIGLIDNLINQITAQGTEIWVKFINGLIAPYTTGGSYHIGTGLFNFNISVPNVSGFFLLFCQLSVPLNIWQTAAQPFNFNVTTSAPTPSGTILNYLAVQNSEPGVGIAAINQGETTYQYSGDAVNNIVLFQPLWSTNTWYISRSVNAINFEFSTPAPSGTQANIFRVPVTGSGQAGYYDSTTAGNLTETIPLTVNAQNIAFVIPSWNTTVGVTPDPVNSEIHLTFSTPVPYNNAELMFVSYDIAI